jgi:thioredoxin reductase
VPSTQVAIIGAGPYGLSIAAHMRAKGVAYRIFGQPMRLWTHEMPEGMHLKSEGFASNLSDPEGRFTLERYCAEHNLPYRHSGLPVPIETLNAYALAFQQAVVPDVDQRHVVGVERSGKDFLVRLEDGELITAQSVVVAVGVSYFRHIPEVFAGIPAEFVTHSGEHRDLTKFKGKSVAVVGRGASAVDIAALLRDLDVDVQLIVRKSSIAFHDAPGPAARPLLDRIRWPQSGIGNGWRSYFLTSAPWAFHYLPEKLRLKVVKVHLPPAPGWFMRDRTVGRVPLLLGQTPQHAEVRDGRVHIGLVDANGARQTVSVDHVISATGFKTDLRRLPFLDGALLRSIRTVENTPVLSASFESSVPGLFFAGFASANSFGPVVRFIVGADFSARRVAGRLAGYVRSRPYEDPAAA